MRVMRHTANVNQVKKPQKSNSFLTNIITNTLSFPLVNYIIFFLKAGHSAHRMAKFTHTGTISTNNIHILYILDHLKSSRGHSLMLSSYNLWQTAYLLGLEEAANACQVSKRLKATNRMITHKNTVINLKSYSPTTSRTPSVHKCSYSDSQNYCNVLVFLSLCEIAHDWIRLRLSNNKIDFTPLSQLQKKPYIT